MLRFKPTFSLSIFPFIKRLFSSSSLSAIRVVSSAYLRLLIFLSAIRFQLASLSHVQLFAILWGAACQVSLSITNSRSLLKLMFIKSVMPPNNFIFCLPLCLLPLIFPCIRVFPNVPVLPIRWPNYWRFSFNIGPFNEQSGLIFFSMDWFYLFAIQGTLKSRPTPQFKSINSLLLSFLYGPTLTCTHDFW